MLQSTALAISTIYWIAAGIKCEANWEVPGNLTPLPPMESLGISDNYDSTHALSLPESAKNEGSVLQAPLSKDMGVVKTRVRRVKPYALSSWLVRLSITLIFVALTFKHSYKEASEKLEGIQPAGSIAFTLLKIFCIAWAAFLGIGVLNMHSAGITDFIIAFVPGLRSLFTLSSNASKPPKLDLTGFATCILYCVMLMYVDLSPVLGPIGEILAKKIALMVSTFLHLTVLATVVDILRYLAWWKVYSKKHDRLLKYENDKFIDQLAEKILAERK